MLNAILNIQSETRNALQLTPPQDHPSCSQSTTPSTEAWTAINIDTAYISEPLYSCRPSCICSCHTVHQLRSPSSLTRLIGALFIDYSGTPRTFNRCSVRNCKARSTLTVQIIYAFPAWIVRDILVSIHVRSFNNGISASLKVRNVVPNGSPIFHYIIINDTGGLRRLFNTCLARPDDIQGTENGEDALTVSSSIYYHFLDLFDQSS